MRQIKKFLDGDTIIYLDQTIPILPDEITKWTYKNFRDSLRREPTSKQDFALMNEWKLKWIDHHKLLAQDAVYLPGITVTPYKYNTNDSLQGHYITRFSTYDDYQFANRLEREQELEAMNAYNELLLKNRMHDTQNTAAKVLAGTLGIAASPALVSGAIAYGPEVYTASKMIWPVVKRAATKGYGKVSGSRIGKVAKSTLAWEGFTDLPEDASNAVSSFSNGDIKEGLLNTSRTATDLWLTGKGIKTVLKFLKVGLKLDKYKTQGARVMKYLLSTGLPSVVYDVNNFFSPDINSKPITKDFRDYNNKEAVERQRILDLTDYNRKVRNEGIIVPKWESTQGQQ